MTGSFDKIDSFQFFLSLKENTILRTLFVCFCKIGVMATTLTYFPNTHIHTQILNSQFLKIFPGQVLVYMVLLLCIYCLPVA